MSKDELVDFIISKYMHYDQRDTFYFFENLILLYHQAGLNYDSFRREIKVFARDSRMGSYFEAFEFNKLGVNYIPPKTKEWFSRVGVLLALVCLYSRQNQTLSTKELFEMLLNLIQYSMESGKVIFAHDYDDSDIHCAYDYLYIYVTLVKNMEI